jgi:hypothetical protein
MNFDTFSKPVLTEPGVKYFLHQTLKQCHIVKDNFHNMMLNIWLFVAFLIGLGLLLLYKYKGKLSPVELERKNKEKHQYILSKLQILQQAKRVAHQELITGLPEWDSEYDIIHSKK